MTMSHQGGSSSDDVASMISSHTIATSIISRHDTPTAVLDAAELAMLRDFCSNPANKDAILVHHDMKDEAGQTPGARALATKGSLVGFLISRYGSEEPGLTGKEIRELREWFEQGGGMGDTGKE